MTKEEWAEVLTGLPEKELSVALLALSDEDWLAERHREWLRGKAADPDGFYPCTAEDRRDSCRARPARPNFQHPKYWYWISSEWAPPENKYRGCVWHDCNTCVIPLATYDRMRGPSFYPGDPKFWLKEYTSPVSAWVDLLEVLSS